MVPVGLIRRVPRHTADGVITQQPLDVARGIFRKGASRGCPRWLTTSIAPSLQGAAKCGRVHSQAIRSGRCWAKRPSEKSLPAFRHAVHPRVFVVLRVVVLMNMTGQDVFRMAMLASRPIRILHLSSECSQPSTRRSASADSRLSSEAS